VKRTKQTVTEEEEEDDEDDDEIPEADFTEEPGNDSGAQQLWRCWQAPGFMLPMLETRGVLCAEMEWRLKCPLTTNLRMRWS